jgi:hypothetical protein
LCFITHRTIPTRHEKNKTSIIQSNVAIISGFNY